jgi:branched-subunit amino acid ABC-type transport system permease component
VYDVAGTKWTTLQVALVAIAAVAMLAVHLLLRRTKLGKAMRATAADPELASSCGINVRRTTSITWTVSGLLLGLSGVALAINAAAFSPVSGDLFVFIVFAAAVVGGLGQPYGAMLGALIIGVTTEEMAVWSPGLKYVAAFALLVVMLLVRPGGLVQLGGRARKDAAQA